MARLVALDGNIGVGKTTFVKPFARRYGYHLIEEPVEDNPHLDGFYANPKRWAYEMEVWFLGERVNAYLRALSLTLRDKKVIIERTHHSCLTFTRNCYLEGWITHEQWEGYERTFRELEDLLPAPDALIFLEAPVEVCYQRMVRRGRPCEKDVTGDYLRGIRRLMVHSNRIMKDKGTKVIKLDWVDPSPTVNASLSSALDKTTTSFLGSMVVVVTNKARRGVHIQDVCEAVRNRLITVHLLVPPDHAVVGWADLSHHVVQDPNVG